MVEGGSRLVPVKPLILLCCILISCQVLGLHRSCLRAGRRSDQAGGRDVRWNDAPVYESPAISGFMRGNRAKPERSAFPRHINSVFDSDLKKLMATAGPQMLADGPALCLPVK